MAPHSPFRSYFFRVALSTLLLMLKKNNNQLGSNLCRKERTTEQIHWPCHGTCFHCTRQSFVWVKSLRNSIPLIRSWKMEWLTLERPSLPKIVIDKKFRQSYPEPAMALSRHHCFAPATNRRGPETTIMEKKCETEVYMEVMNK